MAEFVLYHTDGCHLCHLAEALLQEAGVTCVMVDICDDESLAERYGVRIPVLLRKQDGAELGWPFELVDVTSFTGV
ncbi:glutaredoxin family protein [Shewanella litorisediminis]|uniref:Glutaredoxin family protein n=1 Tax=Shewanella litorisediminis TaxID=1173586 RepID=A0ABX7G7R5_9GAMM|nr:glutaredoxin family protein [Shewanella litorisediminis]MCL2919748.1 glutaredoxin family protein [Shewanella litorisediminis]QRH03309.1 glutaredoxin family protein [Shewanella litorisediminis]